MPEWFPLESNPEQLTKLLNIFAPNSGYGYTDIYTLDDIEILFPFDFEAVLFLFPVDEKQSRSECSDASTCKFIRQITDNACGTIAVLHSIINSNIIMKHAVPEVKKLAELTNAESRGKFIDSTEAFYKNHTAVVNIASVREANEQDLNTNLHFVCFIANKGVLFELDGRYQSPIKHQDLKEGESLLAATAKAVKKRIQESNGALEFTLIGLTLMENVMD